MVKHSTATPCAYQLYKSAPCIHTPDFISFRETVKFGESHLQVTMGKFSSFILLLSLVLAVAQAYKEGYAAPGFDLPGMPIRMDSSATPEDCQALCSVRGTCRGFVFTECESDNRRCYLKYRVANPIPVEPCRVSIFAL